MKVLFINGVFPVISQTFVLDHIKGFIEAGAKVQVLARKKSSFKFEKNIEQCDKGLIYIKPFNSNVFLRCLIGFSKRPVSSSYLLSLRLRKKVHMQTLTAYLQLKEEPDIMITHFGNNYPISTQLKKYILKDAINIVVFHGHDVTSYIEKNGWNKYRKVEDYIDYAICVNKHFAESIKQNTNIKNVKCLYLGTDLPEVVRVDHNQNEVQILFVGRLVEKKGLVYLLLACKLLMDRGFDFKLHIVGDGPLKNDIQSEIMASGIDENTVLYGAKDHNFIMDLMAKCDIFVLPSITAENKDSEGLPVVLMEAMNAGMIVVSTYHSGIPELVKDGENGFLIREGDFIELSRLIRLASEMSDNEKSKMIMAAKELVRMQHDKTIQVNKLIDLVQKA